MAHILIQVIREDVIYMAEEAVQKYLMQAKDGVQLKAARGDRMLMCKVLGGRSSISSKLILVF